MFSKVINNTDLVYVLGFGEFEGDTEAIEENGNVGAGLAENAQAKFLMGLIGGVIIVTGGGPYNLGEIFEGTDNGGKRRGIGGC